VECVFYALNSAIVTKRLYVADAGGSMYIHAFGAYFGIAASMVLHRIKINDQKEYTTKHSDVFSMLGTIFLWMYWPSFNGATLAEFPHQQNRAFVNTYLALTASCIMTFVTSPLLTAGYKMRMSHIQNGTLAGAVGIGACADLNVEPWGAVLIGMISGVVTVLSYRYVTPCLNRRLRAHDTCGVHNLHGIPGVLSGLFSAIAAASIEDKEYTGQGGVTSIYPKRPGNWTRSKQASMQILGLFVSLAFAAVGGVLAGLLAKWIDPMGEQDFFEDEADWEVPKEVTWTGHMAKDDMEKKQDSVQGVENPIPSAEGDVESEEREI